MTPTPFAALTCGNIDEDDDGLPNGDRCERPATHYSCNSWKTGPLNACEDHKCRCTPPKPKPAADTPGADPGTFSTVDSPIVAKSVSYSTGVMRVTEWELTPEAKAALSGVPSSALDSEVTPSSSVDRERVTLATVGIPMSSDLAGRVASLLAEVRRETIEACAKQLDDYEEALATSGDEVMAHAACNCADIVRRNAKVST